MKLSVALAVAAAVLLVTLRVSMPGSTEALNLRSMPESGARTEEYAPRAPVGARAVTDRIHGAAPAPGRGLRAVHLEDRRTGVVLRGARLTLRAPDPIFWATSDRSGSARLPELDGTLRVVLDGYVAREWPWPPAEPGPLVCRLEPEVRVRIEASAADESPLAGVPVRYALEVDGAGDPHDGVIRAFGTTGADGLVERRGLPPGARLSLWFGREPRTLRLPQRPGLFETKLVFPARPEVVGRLVDEAGRGLADELVCWTTLTNAVDPRAVRSGARGEFRLERVPPGPGRLELRVSGCTPREYLVGDEGLDLGELVCPSVRAVCGRVHGHFAGDVVELWRAGVVLEETELDRVGEFRLEATPGTARLLVRSAATARVAARAVDVPSAGVELHLDPAPAVLALAVDPAVARVICGVRRHADAPILTIGPLDVQEGAVRVPTDAPGPHRVWVDGGEGRRGFAESVVAVEANESPTIHEVELGMATLVLEDELPHGSEVNCTAWRFARRAARGVGALAVPPGPVRWAVRTTGTRPFAGGLAHARVGCATRVPVGTSCGKLAGTVSIPSAMHPTELYLSWREAMGYATATTDQAGAFSFPDLAPGWYTLATDEVEWAVFVEAGEETRVALDAPDSRMIPVRRHGRELPGLVSARELELGADGFSSREVKVADGRVELSDVDRPLLVEIEYMGAEGVATGYAVHASGRVAIELGRAGLRLVGDAARQHLAPPALVLTSVAGSLLPRAPHLAVELLPRWTEDGAWIVSDLPEDSVVELRAPPTGWSITTRGVRLVVSDS